MTIAQEKTAAMRIVRRGLAKGYTVSVFDGEEWALKSSTNSRVIADMLCSTDSDVVRFRKMDGEKVGSVLFIWGNSPEEVAADHTDNAEIAELVGND